jgi:hypothetical protein
MTYYTRKSSTCNPQGIEFFQLCAACEWQTRTQNILSLLSLGLFHMIYISDTQTSLIRRSLVREVWYCEKEMGNI